MQEFSTHLIENIQRRLDPRLAEFYIKNSEHSKQYSASYTELIREILEKECDNKDSKSMSKFETSKRRSRAGKRKRYYKKCQDMLSAKMWNATNIDAFCFRNLVLGYRILADTEKVEKVYGAKTLEDLCYEKLEVVKIWADDSESMMIDYPGTEKKTARAMYANFIIDLTIDILRVVNSEFSGDLASQTASYVDNVSENVVFSITSEKIKVNKTGPTEVTVYKNEDKSSWVKMTYTRIDDKADFVSSLDSKDYEIASYINTRLIQAPPTQRPLLIRKLDVVRVYMRNTTRTPSKRDYDMVSARVAKISSIQFTCSNVDSVKWGAFCLIGDIFERTIAGEDYFECHPSGYIEGQIENGMILRLPMDSDDAATLDPTAKLLRPLFIKQRIRSYRSLANGEGKNEPYTVDYHYQDFMLYINFGNSNLKDGRDAVRKALDSFVASGKIVKNYSYSRITDTYTITFYELSDTEIKDIDFILYKGGVNRLSDNIVGQILMSDIIPS